MSIETHPGDSRCPRRAGEDLGDYMERYSKWLQQFRPWQRTAEPPKEEPRLPYREPGEEG